MEGPTPFDMQVRSHATEWRKRHKRDAMQPVIDSCQRCMYGAVENVSESGDNLLVLSDSDYDGGTMVPKLGNGSVSSPFRIGLTCCSLLVNCVAIQQDPRCTTILHIDSTHSIVKQRYSVFGFGISYACGKFHPVIYFCTSQRIGIDVAWCCAFLKRVIWEVFMVKFKPQVTMTDADNAQYNAVFSELPGCTILMCWFHVCKNVKDYVEKAKLEPVTADMVYRDLNDLHYPRNKLEYIAKQEYVLVSWRSAATFCPAFKKVADRIIDQWILYPRFSNWQAFHSPPRYATTNNPLEQYHRTLKLINKSPRATPAEMIDRLDKSRLVFINSQTTFNRITTVSQRLKAQFHLSDRKKELRASPISSSADLPVQHVQVCHRPRRRYGDEESQLSHDFFAENTSKPSKPFKPIRVLRMQWKDMPTGGWLVDAAARTCACRFSAKFGTCVHVIKCAQVLALPCPGMPAPVARFVSAQRDRNSNSDLHHQQRSDVLDSTIFQVTTEAVDNEVVFGPLPSPPPATISSVFGPHLHPQDMSTPPAVIAAALTYEPEPADISFD